MTQSLAFIEIRCDGNKNIIYKMKYLALSWKKIRVNCMGFKDNNKWQHCKKNVVVLWSAMLDVYWHDLAQYMNLRGKLNCKIVVWGFPVMKG